MTTMTTTQRTNYGVNEIAQLFPSLMKLTDKSLRERVAAVWRISVCMIASVGQPRDLCPDACYAVSDPQAGWVEFRRVHYEVAKTRRKISRAKLPAFAAQRLSLGR